MSWQYILEKCDRKIGSRAMLAADYRCKLRIFPAKKLCYDRKCFDFDKDVITRLNEK